MIPDQTGPLQVTFAGPVRIVEPRGLGLIWQGELPSAVIETIENGLLIQGQPYPEALRLSPAGGQNFGIRRRWDGANREQTRHYRGVLDVFHLRAGGFRLVNELTVEEYIAGVVGREMQAAGFSLEALKAQAVAARTFTLFHLRAGGPMDINVAFPGNSRFQAYGGVEFETPDVLRAVRETTGLVLTYDGKMFQAYYHSSCGGGTASGTFFNERDIPPLAGVLCDFCEGAPQGEWESHVALDGMGRALRSWASKRKVDLGKIIELAPVMSSPGGHVGYVRVTHSGGSFEMRADRLRSLLNREKPGALRSTAFAVEIRDGGAAGLEAVFRGKGFGHGVGLCQHGARTLARERDFREILAYYFPESNLMKLVY